MQIACRSEILILRPLGGTAVAEKLSMRSNSASVVRLPAHSEVVAGCQGETGELWRFPPHLFFRYPKQ